MVTSTRRSAGAALTVAVLSVLTACTSAKPTKVVTVTVPPSSASATPTTTPSSATASPSASGSTVAVPANQTKLPGDCAGLLPDYAVAPAIGKDSFAGADAFVVGVPDATIGRVATINCRYGVTGSGDNATPALEIGVSLYRTAAQAAARITATAADYTAHGARSTDLTVGGQPATLLTDGVGDGYTVPTLVTSVGQRTIAVGIAASLATGDRLTADTGALAVLAAQKTAA